jgi:hypothetical protein
MVKGDYKIYGIFLIQLLVFALLNGFGVLGTDDIYTIHSTSGNFMSSLHQAIHFEMQAPLYFLLMSLWRGISETLFWAKLFHYISFLISSIFFYKILKILVSNRKDISILLLFFALHPFLFYISNDLRRYSLSLLFAVITLYYFIKIYVKGDYSKKDRIFLILISTAGIFNDYYHTFLLASLGVGVLFSEVKFKWNYFIDMIIPVAGFLVLLRVILYQIGSSGDWPVSYIESGLLFSSFKHILFLLESQSYTFFNFGLAGNLVVRLAIITGLLLLIRIGLPRYPALYISAAFMIVIFLTVIFYLRSTSLLSLEYTAFYYPLIFLCFSLILLNAFKNDLARAVVVIGFITVSIVGYHDIHSNRYQFHRDLKEMAIEITNSFSDRVVFVFNPKDAAIINFYIVDQEKKVIGVPGKLDFEVYRYSARTVESEEQIRAVLAGGIIENSEFYMVFRNRHLKANTYNSNLLFRYLNENFVFLSEEKFGLFFIILRYKISSLEVE